MKQPKIKKVEDVVMYDYAVCDLQDCVAEAKILAMTETRYVDFCEIHHREYILGE